MRVLCPGCDVKLRVSADDADTRISCPKCGEKFRPSEADEADDKPAKKKGKKAGKAGLSNSTIITIAVGGVVALIVVGVGAYAVYLNTTAKAEPPFNPQPMPREGAFFPPNNNPPAQNPFNPPDSQFKGNPNPPVGPSRPARSPLLAELDDLFKPVVNSTPPTARAALLDQSADAMPLEVPTFHSLRVARQPASAKPAPFAKLTLDDIKAATVYIRVDAGELSGTGSGFYIGVESGVALVATNYHVIEAAASKRRELDQGSAPGLESGLEPGKEPKLKKPPKITLVFNSGESGSEYESTAQILGVDPIADLAVLRVDKPGKLPKPINPWDTPPVLTETTEIRFFGFPYGNSLATSGQKNPNITVGTGTISSLRKNKAGSLDKVQINGTLNPGNSGGPILDKDGRLVGIAVSKFSKGEGLGFAVPVNELIAMLEGKILLTAFIPDGIEGNAAKFQVLIPIMDPRSQVHKAYVRYWAGNGPKPKGVKDPKIGWKPIERAVQVDMDVPKLRSSLTFAVGKLTLPTDATEVVIQIASENEGGLVAASAPVTYKLNVKDVANGRDARPFAELAANADALAGQTVVVRGRILGVFTRSDEYQPIIVSDLDNHIPARMLFLTDRATAVQFDEVNDDDQLKDVRLTCVVGKRGPTGILPVRVARADFLNEGSGVVRTVPEADTKDQLAALNRDPVKFVGQRLTFEAAAAPYTVRSTESNDLFVMFPNLNRPRSLSFVAAKGLMQKILDAELQMNALYKVRIAVKVDGNTPASGTRTQVTVTKIEILDSKDDTVLKTIE